MKNNLYREFNCNSKEELYEKIKSEHPIPPRRWIPLMNNKIENVILKLLDKKPYKRFPNASLVAETLLSEEVKLTEKSYDLTPKFILQVSTMVSFVSGSCFAN